MYRVAFWRKHVSELIEVAIEEPDGLHYRLLPPTDKILEIRGRHKIDEQQYRTIMQQIHAVKGLFHSGVCGVPKCRRESEGIDRGVPLCGRHWDQLERIREKDLEPDPAQPDLL